MFTTPTTIKPIYYLLDIVPSKIALNKTTLGIDTDKCPIEFKNIVKTPAFSDQNTVTMTGTDASNAFIEVFSLDRT